MRQVPNLEADTECSDTLSGEESFHSCTADDGFICPYCGKCTIGQFLSEDGCPQKDQSTSKKLFPYLDTSNLPKHEIEALEMRLKSDTRKMRTTFADFTVDTGKSLVARKESLDEIKDTVLSLQAFTDDIDLKLLAPQDEEKIESAASVGEVFIVLRRYVSFFNYQIIEHLIKHHGSTEDHKRLEEYLNAFNTFCERNIFEVPPNVFSSSLRRGKKFCIKCTEGVATLKSVQGVIDKIAGVFGLQPLALQLCLIKKGCVELHFLISAAVANHILPVSPSQGLALSEIGVRVLSCEGTSQANKDKDVARYCFIYLGILLAGCNRMMLSLSLLLLLSQIRCSLTTAYVSYNSHVCFMLACLIKTTNSCL